MESIFSSPFLPTLALLLVIGVLLTIIAALTRKQQGDNLLPYRQKQYFFSRSESEFYRSLTEKIDSSKYHVFPKVRLADFVEVKPGELERMKFFNYIKAKHVDFILWDVAQQKIALVIELDGKSHRQQKVKGRDTFVESVYETIGITLVRIQVGSNFNEEIQHMLENISKVEPVE